MTPYLFQINRERLTPYMFELNEFAKNHETQYTPDIRRNAVQHYTYGFPHITNDKNYVTKDRYYSTFVNTVKHYSSFNAADYPDCIYANKSGLTDAMKEELCKAYKNREKLDTTVEDEYKNSGSKESFTEWYEKWRKTEKGKAVIGIATAGFDKLWDKIFGTGTAVTPIDDYDDDKPKKILGMSPLVFGIVSVVVVTGIIIAIVKLAK